MGNTASASIDVIAPPTITKVFGATTLAINGTTSLTFTVTAPGANPLSLSGVTFTDTLPAGLVVATPNGVSSSCDASFSAGAGSGTATLSSLSMGAGASCTFKINVTGTTSGTKNNSVTVNSTNGGTGNTSNASLSVGTPPSVSANFGASSIPLTGTTSLTFTVTNNDTSGSITGVGFTDTLPAGLVLATPNGLAGSCGGGTITATAGTSLISLSAATLAASANCSFSVNVQGTAAGAQNDSTSAVTSNEDGSGNLGSASINVFAPPTIAKAFGASGIVLNASTSLTFTVANPSVNPATMYGIAFTDSLPAGLVVATPSGLNTSFCGGESSIITATAGSSSVTLTGGYLSPGSNCVISLNVTGTTAGAKSNSVTANSTSGGTGNTSTANLNVEAPMNFSKSFVSPSVPLNGITGLNFYLTNPAGNPISQTGVAFTDTLPAGLVVATPNGLTGTCGGTITAVAGSSVISLTGASTVSSPSCTFSVNVTGTTVGVKNNVTSAVTSVEGGTGSTASASVTVVAPPTITKTFGAGSIPVNGTTSLSFTVGNPSANTVQLNGIAFTDALPAGLPSRCIAGRDSQSDRVAHFSPYLLNITNREWREHKGRPGTHAPCQHPLYDRDLHPGADRSKAAGTTAARSGNSRRRK